jgi:site-specific recombinase XerD
MNNAIPLAPYIRSFFEDHLRCRCHVSHNTILSYRDALKLFLPYAAQRQKRSVAKLLVADVTEEVVVSFLADLEQRRSNSIQTRNYRLAALHALFGYIASREPLLLDHCHRILTIPRKRGAQLPEIRYLEKEEITGILNAVDRSKVLGQRDHAMLLFLYNTGARVQELADVRITWLSLCPPFKVDLLGKGRKWRSCPLWESTTQHLRELIVARNARLDQDEPLFVNRFGRQLSRSGIAEIIDRHVTRAAVALPSLRSRKITPHTFRHTTAMHLLQAGVEVNVIRSWLGHVSIATTNRYVEIDLDMKKKALATCEVGPGEKLDPSWRRAPNILTWLESL